MKSILLASLALATSAFAQSRPVTCSAGTIGDDRFVQVQIKADRVEVQMHESFYTIAGRDVITAGNSRAILNLNTQMQSEGETTPVNINALLVYTPASHALNFTFVENGAATVRAVDLKCK